MFIANTKIPYHSKLTLKTAGGRDWDHYGPFNASFEYIKSMNLAFSLRACLQISPLTIYEFKEIY